jgi:hypothetical protein
MLSFASAFTILAALGLTAAAPVAERAATMVDDTTILQYARKSPCHLRMRWKTDRWVILYSDLGAPRGYILL